MFVITYKFHMFFTARGNNNCNALRQQQVKQHVCHDTSWIPNLHFLHFFSLYFPCSSFLMNMKYTCNNIIKVYTNWNDFLQLKLYTIFQTERSSRWYTGLLSFTKIDIHIARSAINTQIEFIFKLSDINLFIWCSSSKGFDLCLKRKLGSLNYLDIYIS